MESRNSAYAKRRLILHLKLFMTRCQRQRRSLDNVSVPTDSHHVNLFACVRCLGVSEHDAIQSQRIFSVLKSEGNEQHAVCA